MSKILTDKQAKKKAQKECRKLGEAKLSEFMQFMKLSIEGSIKFGDFERRDSQRKLKEIISFFRHSDTPNSRLLEIANQFKNLSIELKDAIFAGSGIFANPNSCLVDRFREASEAFIKMAAAKPLAELVKSK